MFSWLIFIPTLSASAFILSLSAIVYELWAGAYGAFLLTMSYWSLQVSRFFILYLWTLNLLPFTWVIFRAFTISCFRDYFFSNPLPFCFDCELSAVSCHLRCHSPILSDRPINSINLNSPWILILIHLFNFNLFLIKGNLNL